MATDLTTSQPTTAEMLPPECLPNYDLLVTEDDTPVDNVYAERQHLLLTASLIDSWPGPGEGCPRFITTDVGLFFAVDKPPFSPDVMISLGVSPPRENPLAKENRSYFIWKYGKPPEMIVEVVSNRIGGELTTKLRGYARIGVIYYVVWDPDLLLGDKALHCFVLSGGEYVPCEPWFPLLELGVTSWDGVYGDMETTFLRWCDQQGRIVPTGAERAESEKQRADAEKQRAESEKQRAERLAEKLRAMGVDPDQP